MTELWRHMLDLSIELDRLDENGNYRQGLEPVLRRGDMQRRSQCGPQARSAAEYREHLERELEAVSSQSQKSRTNKPKRNEWLNLAVVCFSGAIMSLANIGFLAQGEAGKGRMAEALAPASLPDTGKLRPSEALAAATDKGDGNLVRGEALSEQVSNRLNPEAAAAVQTPDTMAQLSEDALLERASNQLNLGDVAGARAIYETMAQGGSSRGAFGLAETYDPNFFARHPIRGLKPDQSLARLWYERAAKLGSSEASKRQKALTEARSSASQVLRR